VKCIYTTVNSHCEHVYTLWTCIYTLWIHSVNMYIHTVNMYIHIVNMYIHTVNMVRFYIVWRLVWNVYTHCEHVYTHCEYIVWNVYTHCEYTVWTCIYTMWTRLSMLLYFFVNTVKCINKHVAFFLWQCYHLIVEVWHILSTQATSVYTVIKLKNSVCINMTIIFKSKQFHFHL